MTPQWHYLALAVLFGVISAAQFLIMRSESRSGEGMLFFVKLPSLKRELNPSLFKGRLASYWVGIVIFAAAALACLAGFLGIVE